MLIRDPGTDSSKLKHQGAVYSHRFGRRATLVKNGNAGTSKALVPMGENQFPGPCSLKALLSRK